MALTAIDLFAGAGGFGLGFKLAGFDISLSVEIDQWACDTLKYNDPYMRVLQGDIREYRTKEIIQEVSENHPDVVIGGPPCQGFSIAGSSKKDPNDPRNSLFIEFANWVKVLEPKIFILENVKGLLGKRNAQGEPVIQIIQKTFEEIGYVTNVWVLNAAEYGVPQLRERIFVVGSQNKILKAPTPTHMINNVLGRSLLFPKLDKLSPINLWEAISDLPILGAGEGDEEQEYVQLAITSYQKWVRQSSNCLYNHSAMRHSKRLVERFSHIQWGESSADAPTEHGPRERNSNGKLSTKVYDQNNRRLHPDKPSHTIAASFYANFIHPYQNRNLTAREGARIQSFPDYYRFMGKKTVVSQKLLNREERFSEAHLCQYNQIGNAVPPLLAQKIAEHIAKEVLNAGTCVEYSTEGN